MRQPSANVGAAGRSDGLPSGAPPAAHRAITFFCSAESRRSFANVPGAASAYHGGMLRSATRRLIACAHGRASAYVRSDIGAISPARWQLTQFAYKIGATSCAKVGTASDWGAGVWDATAAPQDAIVQARASRKVRYCMAASAYARPVLRSGPAPD